MTELTRIPDADKITVKPAFEKHYRTLLGPRYDEFMRYSLSYITKSIRVNTLKASVSDVKKRLEQQGFTLRQVPWCGEGFFVRGERTDLGNLLEHALGYIYIQEAASMLPPMVLRPEPGDVVLDMCSSPGSKTTEMAAMMHNEGLLVANDISGARMKPLGLNVQRMGARNVTITVMLGQQFSKRGVTFDKILVDAPCSGTGTIRRSLDTLRIWNPLMIKRLSKTQKSLIETAFSVLKSGGEMVYSTCSVEPEENEEVVDTLLKNHADAVLEKIDLDIQRSEPVLEWEGKAYSTEIKKCLRIFPQDNNTEGFFVAKIIKE